MTFSNSRESFHRNSSSLVCREKSAPATREIKETEETSVCPMCLAGIAQIVIGATATGVLTTFVSQKLQQKSKTLDVLKIPSNSAAISPR